MGFGFARKLGVDEEVGHDCGQSPPSLVAPYGGIQWRIDGIMYSELSSLGKFLTGSGYNPGDYGYTHVAEFDLPKLDPKLKASRPLEIRNIFNLQLGQVLSADGRQDLVGAV